MNAVKARRHHLDAGDQGRTLVPSVAHHRHYVEASLRFRSFGASIATVTRQSHFGATPLLESHPSIIAKSCRLKRRYGLNAMKLN